MIQPSSPYQGSPRIAGPTPHSASASARPTTPSTVGTDQLSIAGAESLRSALSATPEVRPEVVTEGRRLAVDPNYPPLQIIEELAKMLLHSADPAENV